MASVRGHDITVAELSDVVQLTLTTIYKQHGGPTNYLMSRYDSEEEKIKFANQLYSIWPPSATEDTTFNACIPSFAEANLKDARKEVFHIAMFNFSKDASPKEPTSMKTSLQLAERYFLETFLTGSEAILTAAGSAEDMRKLSQIDAKSSPWHSQDIDPMPPFCLHIHKGAARIRTCLCICSIFIDDEVDMKAIAPKLWQSFRDVYCHNLNFGTLKEQAFSNFKMSVRGSIRQAPNMMSWFVMLDRLRQKGDTDAGGIIRQWNKDASRSSQITGTKAQAVKNVLELASPSTINLLLQTTSAYGWENSPWTEEALSSKKLFPGQHFRTVASRVWTARQAVTQKSSELTFQKAARLFEQMPSGCRSRYNKGTMEQLSEVTAVFYNLCTEATTKSPITVEMLQDKGVYNKWRDSDPKLELEVNAAMVEKSDSFHPKMLSCIQQLLEGHTPGTTAQIMMSERAVEGQSAQLEESTFELLLQQAEYDQAAMRVRDSKMASWERGVYARKLEYSVGRHSMADQAARAHMEQWSHFHLYKAPEDAMGHFNTFMKEIAAKHSIDIDHIVPVCVLNWVAPCSLSSQALSFQANFLAMLASTYSKMIAPILCPQWAYKKGQLYLSEQMVYKLLIDRNLNFDHKFGLTFSERLTISLTKKINKKQNGKHKT